MKNKYINLLIILITIFFLIEIIIHKVLVSTTIEYSLNIWINSLIPSLFPMFIISDILNNYNLILYIPSMIKNTIKKIFNISNNACFIFLISLLSGFPSNARNIRILYQDNKLRKEEAEHLLYYTHFASPMFILGTIPKILNNNNIGIYILLSHYLSNIIIAILVRKLNNNYNNYNININNNSINFSILLINSIKSTINSLLSILGTTTIFLIISNLTINIFNLNSYNSLLLKSILEITSAIKELSINNFNNKLLIILSTSIISFGGLSVHLQVINELSSTNIKYTNFFIGRILQTILSIVISYLLCLFTF